MNSRLWPFFNIIHTHKLSHWPLTICTIVKCLWYNINSQARQITLHGSSDFNSNIWLIHFTSSEHDGFINSKPWDSDMQLKSLFPPKLAVTKLNGLFECERQMAHPVTFQALPPLYKCFLWALHQINMRDKCKGLWKPSIWHKQMDGNKKTNCALSVSLWWFHLYANFSWIPFSFPFYTSQQQKLQHETVCVKAWCHLVSK